MRAMIQFLRTLLRMPKLWLVWVFVLVMVNLVSPIMFISTLEAKIVLAAFGLGVILQVAIFSARGFVRLLGIGHVAWIPLVIWLAARLESLPLDSVFCYWLGSVVVVNSSSLLIDAVDVLRYLKGDRAPQLARYSAATGPALES
jgi:hypothetical protein